MTAAFPREPDDPVITKYRWLHPRGMWKMGRFLASVGETPAAFITWAHAVWEKNPERHMWLEVYLDLGRMDFEILRAMWEWLEEEALKEGGAVLNASAAEEEKVLQRVLGELGYELDRTDKMWHLDLEKHGPRLSAEAAAARDRASKTGITFTTLADWKDSDKLPKLHALNERTRQDIPTSVPVVPEPYEAWIARMDSPDKPHDRWWLALDGDRPVAMSVLAYPPVRGNVWTAYTCTHPDYRGRGLAKGIKLQTLTQAIELGVPHVHTDNDSENGPMLHINEMLGYEPIPGFSTYQKRVSR